MAALIYSGVPGLSPPGAFVPGQVPVFKKPAGTCPYRAGRPDEVAPVRSRPDAPQDRRGRPAGC